jgi:hypothetical protein
VTDEGSFDLVWEVAGNDVDLEVIARRLHVTGLTRSEGPSEASDELLSAPSTVTRWANRSFLVAVAHSDRLTRDWRSRQWSSRVGASTANVGTLPTVPTGRASAGTRSSSGAQIPSECTAGWPTRDPASR